MGRTREGRGNCSGARPQTRADVGLCNCVRPLDQSVRASAIRHDAVEPLATEVAIGYDLVFAVLRCAARGRVVRRSAQPLRKVASPSPAAQPNLALDRRPRVTGTPERPLKMAQPEVRRKCFVNTPHLIDTEPTGALAETLHIYCAELFDEYQGRSTTYLDRRTKRRPTSAS